MDKKIIAIIVLVLIVVLAIFVYLNMNSNKDNIMKYKDEVVTLKQNGETVSTVTMEEIINYGGKEIEAVLDTSDSEPTTYKYTGILLKTLLEKEGVDYTKSKAVISTAVDGFVSAIPMNKVLDDDNIYLVYEWEGKPLGTKEEEGKGPFMIIIKEDQFSQNWCKYVVEVNCQ